MASLATRSVFCTLGFHFVKCFLFDQVGGIDKAYRVDIIDDGDISRGDVILSTL